MNATSTFTQIKCWEDERISKVINKEAISIDRKEFLITHTPFDGIRVLKSPENQTVVNEESFLVQLLERAKQNLHTFGVIQGVPGSGKSHLIRWLKERYAIHNRTDEVILIERFNSTLKGVLEQIIQSQAFSTEQMTDQLEKLRKAFGHLSDKSLGVLFIGNLRIGTHEIEISVQDQYTAYIKNHISDWLTDKNVQDFIMRPGGPVDRVRRHLAKNDNERGLREDEYPGILPDDLLIDMETQAKMEATYESEREFTKSLFEDEELRITTAKYLDSLVSYAIGRSVSLSGEDLKTIFFELRQNLKKKGKSLALFIEDITAFTGIDNGLVDVLVAQHTGEGNRAYCRVLSVIGITDGFFKDKFQKNYKDRMDIHLTLNNQDDSSAQSGLLLNKDVLTGMVARYLNAIRASDTDIEHWASLGENLSSIPVRCNDCEFKKECFIAFGESEVQMSRDGQKYQIGLYPFNIQAIQTMFDQLDNAVIKTPRSLLTSVVEYVLHNHGMKIPRGEFPPPPKRLGGEFKPPEMRETFQRTVLDAQAGPNSERIRSLILFWGDKTIYSETKDNERYLGGLPETVFKVFSLPMIQGQLRGRLPLKPPKTDPRSDPPGEPQTPIYRDHGTYERFINDISAWRDGDLLHSYETYAGWVARFWRDSIQWAEYGISQFQGQIRLTPGRIYFEGQGGEGAKSQIRFTRSGFMADVLHALAQIEFVNIPLNKIKEDQAGAIVSVLSRWRSEDEQKVAMYVKGMSEYVPEITTIFEVSILNNITVNTLGGFFTKVDTDPISIYKNLVFNACQRIDRSDSNHELSRSDLWKRLYYSISRDSIENSRINFLSLLNLPQGSRSPIITRTDERNTVSILDAEKALSNIRIFSEHFEPKKFPQNPDFDDPIWKNELAIYIKMQDQFLPTLQDQVQELSKLIELTQYYLGADTPQKVFESLDKVDIAYRSVYKLYNEEIRRDLNGSQLDLLLRKMKGLVDEMRVNQLSLLLSTSSSEISLLRVYQQYLKRQYEGLQENAKNLQELLLSTPGGISKEEEQSVFNLYKQIDEKLVATIENLVKG